MVQLQNCYLDTLDSDVEKDFKDKREKKINSTGKTIF